MLMGPVAGMNLVAQQTDLLPPQASILSVAPQVVDVTDGEAQTTVRIRITDDVSGLSSGSLVFGFGDTGLKWFLDNDNLVEGLPTDGIYEVDLTIPAGSPPGERWLSISIVDQARRWFTKDFDSPNFTVVNNGPYDREPPTLHAVNIIPKTVDLSDGPASVVIEFDVSDDFSGISHLRADPISPHEDYRIDARFVFPRPTEGDERKILRSEFRLGKYAPAGVWSIYLDEFIDNVNRSSPYDFGDPSFRETFDPIFTVINPNEDKTPPQLVSVTFPEPNADTTFGETQIPFNVEVSDDNSGLRIVSVRAHSPSSGKEIFEYFREEAGFPDNPLSIDGLLTVPPFIEEGSWPVSVRVQDIAGNTAVYGYGSDLPLPGGSTQYISVLNELGEDLTDMVITDFQIIPDPVDVTDRSVFAEVLVSFSDNLAGLNYLSARFESPDGEFRESVFLDEEELVSGTLINGTVRGFIQIPRYSQPGAWELQSISLSDRAGNLLWLTSTPVFSNEFPNAITVVNNGPVDTEPPVMGTLSLPQSVVDVSVEDQRIPILATASDDFSGVERIILTFELESSGDAFRLFLSEWDIASIEGTISSFEDESLIRAFQPPGDYRLTEIEVQDVMGRESVYSNDEQDLPFPVGLPQSLTIVNNGPADFEDPVITGIRLSQTTFDVSNGLVTFVAEIDYTDDVSGVEDFEIRMSHEGGLLSYDLFDSWIDGDPIQIISGDLTNGTARLVCVVPAYAPEGIYTLTYSVDDQLRRGTNLRGGSTSFPFPDAKIITIQNSGPDDRQNPRVVSLELPESVDVTDLAQEIGVRIGYLDDTSGPNEVAFSMESPSGKSIRHELVGEDLLIENPEEGTLHMVLTIPAFSEAGTWELRTVIYDGMERIELLDHEELEALGMPSTIEVVNRQPPDYLWRESVAYADNWRHLDWFGWLQDPGTYPYAFHLEHGWIYSGGSDPEAFYFYDFPLQTWWWVKEDLYPYLYASGRLSGWYFYYAPFGRPGERWFHSLASGTDIKEGDL